jgi:putative exosortase-associated protein (TIGR04073 family)
MILLGLAGSALALAGCAGPENKLGRGLGNIAEPIRLGEMSRSLEQTALWDTEGAGSGGATGFVRGFNRTMARTGVGVYEVATFALPPYGPLFTPKNNLYPDSSVKNKRSPWTGQVMHARPRYPASYKPGWRSDSIYSTDTTLGFSGGEVFPFVPGSRFRIFEE